MNTKEEIEYLKKELRILKVQLNGNPENPKDFGLNGLVKDQAVELAVFSAIKKQVWRWLSVLIMAGLMWTCIYFINSVRDASGNDNTSRNDNNSNYMDDPTKRSRGRKDSDTYNNPTRKHGD